MKLEKNKHNHKLTDLLKVGIFSLLMIAPLLACISQWLYAICNKNAKDSYSGSTWTELQEVYYESNEIETYQDLHINSIYHWNDNFSPVTVDVARYLFRVKNTTNIQTQFNVPSNIDTLDFAIGSNGYALMIYTISTNNYGFVSITDKPFDFVVVDYLGSFSFTENIISYFNESNMKLVKEYIQVQQQETLDNSFYYGVQRMTEEELFNWTENTLLYTGIKGMTDNLGVQTNAIAILITYWTILTIIYVILDIVIKGFTFITHLIVRSE